MSIFEYAFMQRAFIVGILLGMTIPCIGTIIVLKRLSMLGDTLSHTSLAGVAGGLVFHINPVVGATVTCIGAALGIEAIRKKIPQYAEIAIAIMLSVGIGTAAVLSGFVSNAANFNSFLFGSIVAISDTELYMVITLSVIVLILFILFYKELFYVTFDESSARLVGIRINGINFMFTILTAITVSVATRIVGTLVISSIMVLPVACALQLKKGFRKTVLYSMLFGVVFHIIGLFLAYYIGIKPGGTIILVGVFWFVLIGFIKLLTKQVKWIHQKEIKNDGHLYHFRFFRCRKNNFYTKFTEANTEK
ncbi:MAG: metal ABC transporter permease [Acutalibacteraceae bacterium]